MNKQYKDMNRVVIQEAVLKANSGQMENIKEEMKAELLKKIDALKLEDMISVEERENCYFLKSDCRFV